MQAPNPNDYLRAFHLCHLIEAHSFTVTTIAKITPPSKDSSIPTTDSPTTTAGRAIKDAKAYPIASMGLMLHLRYFRLRLLDKRTILRISWHSVLKSQSDGS